MKSTVILGGGIAGLSLGAFLNKKTTILERGEVVGGLSRSYDMNGIKYDIGPHIIFSKNKEVLDLHTTMIDTNKIRRSNQIFYKKRYIKYPFENDLVKLDEEEKRYCVQEFLHNPYERYHSQNMLQFFLKTFGEGITRTYLQPYNEKIWKFDPACMDTQMVDRIPKPPKEDVIKSAEGIETEGYTHQLYYHYPKVGGFQTMVDAYAKKCIDKGATIQTSAKLEKLEKKSSGWDLTVTGSVSHADQLLNCIPLHELFKFIKAPEEVTTALNNLLYNSIHVVMVQAKKDKIGNHFALYLPDKETIFHRLSKLNYLGESYCAPDGACTLMAEVTFRPDSYLGTLSVKEVEEKVVDGLVKAGFIEKSDITAIETKTEKYAYVIYDLDHRKNADTVLNYLKSVGIECAGRFAQFEYLNTDGVVENTLKLARRLNESNE